MKGTFANPCLFECGVPLKKDTISIFLLSLSAKGFMMHDRII